MTSGSKRVTRTAGEVADWLRAQGYLQEIKASADPSTLSVERLGKAESTEPATMAWAGTPELGAAFGGSVLIASAAAAASADPDVVVLVCENPAAAWVDVATALFSHLSADQPAVWNDDADRERAEEGMAWVRNAHIARGAAIGPHACIGMLGMTLRQTTSDGRALLFPHFGLVEVGEGAVIAAQATIQRGMFDSTIIGRDVWIGPNTNIGHGVRIGAGTVIGPNVSIAGYVEIGAGASIWQSASIRNAVSIGEGAVVAMGSIVRHDVGPGELWAGNPARRAGLARES
jgi:UDP-3-O-[3-hydroxymyristoyl] glucosamine N-acyltransferase